MAEVVFELCAACCEALPECLAACCEALPECLAACCECADVWAGCAECACECAPAAGGGICCFGGECTQDDWYKCLCFVLFCPVLCLCCCCLLRKCGISSKDKACCSYAIKHKEGGYRIWPSFCWSFYDDHAVCALNGLCNGAETSCSNKTINYAAEGCPLRCCVYKIDAADHVSKPTNPRPPKGLEMSVHGQVNPDFRDDL